MPDAEEQCRDKNCGALFAGIPLYEMKDKAAEQKLFDHRADDRDLEEHPDIIAVLEGSHLRVKGLIARLQCRNRFLDELREIQPEQRDTADAEADQQHLQRAADRAQFEGRPSLLVIPLDEFQKSAVNKAEHKRRADIAEVLIGVEIVPRDAEKREPSLGEEGKNRIDVTVTVN